MDQPRPDDFAAGILHVFDVVRPEVVFATALVAARVDVVEHHALGEQALEGLIDLHQPEVAHDLGPEAGVEQVQNGVLDAADVLVHRHPVARAFADHGLGVAGVAVAHVVPGRIDEGVHGVGFAPRRCAADRAGDAGMEAFVAQQRVAAAVGDAVFGQHHGQIALGHRHRAVLGAVDDGDRGAPVALPADAPVAQPPGGFFLAQALRGQQLGHFVDGLLVCQAVEHAGIHARQPVLVGVPVLPAGGVEGVGVGLPPW